jgi:hypothetical protein
LEKAVRVSRRRIPALVVALLVTTGLTACGDNGPATEFCTDYGDAIHKLIAAARDYEAAEFVSTLESTLSTLDELRWDAPDERLRDAFNTASFTFTVFSSPELLADFVRRADFSDNAMVLACAEYGVRLTPAAG